MLPARMYEVDFEPVGKRIEVTSGTRLIDAARSAGIELASDCGGEGHCGRCRVAIIEGNVTPPNDSEKFIFTELEMWRGERLACCTNIQGDVKVYLPKSSLMMDQRLQLTGSAQPITVDPAIKAYQITVPAPSLRDQRADAQRILDALAQTHHLPHLSITPLVIAQISNNARAYGWQMTVYVRESEIVGIAPAVAKPIGLAIDAGTTKLAACLVDLESGRELAVTGAMNPQIGYGEDVISRLVFSHRNTDGDQVMATMIRSAFDDMLGDLVRQAGVGREQVADVCIVGNTAMTHLLLQLPVHQLAVSPYVAATAAAIDVKAHDLNLHTAPGAYVHILPCIGGFVGADHVAMILASELDHANRVTLGIDIGTNTEIVLARPDGTFLASVSCASGPAFEGAHISNGMRAASGAIEAVRLTDTRINLKTVDDAPAVGLCGSGIVDAIAELYHWHFINTHGRFDRDNSRVREGSHGLEFVLVPAEKSSSQRDIAISQKDINEIQLAKGAIRAGLDVLLTTAGISYAEVEEVLIAGAFGSYLNIQSALAIGLFPYFPNAIYRQIGNAAVSGAIHALVSQQARARAQYIASAARHIELTTNPRFRRLFAYGMLFPDDTRTTYSKESICK